MELIQLKPLNEGIIALMENNGLSKMEQVGILQLIIFDIATGLTEDDE